MQEPTPRMPEKHIASSLISVWNDWDVYKPLRPQPSRSSWSISKRSKSVSKHPSKTEDYRLLMVPGPYRLHNMSPSSRDWDATCEKHKLFEKWIRDKNENNMCYEYAREKTS